MARTTSGLRMALVAMALWGSAGCQSSPTPQQTVMPAPDGTPSAAARHNDEGLLAFQEGQWVNAKQHFQAAIMAASDLAEAHYNLGMTLYRLGNVTDGDHHFIEAANLAPGNKVIWNSPPLRNAAPREKLSLIHI